MVNNPCPLDSVLILMILGPLFYDTCFKLYMSMKTLYEKSL